MNDIALFPYNNILIFSILSGPDKYCPIRGRRDGEGFCLFNKANAPSGAIAFCLKRVVMKVLKATRSGRSIIFVQGICTESLSAPEVRYFYKEYAL